MEIDFRDARRQAGELIIEMLRGDLSPDECLGRWPFTSLDDDPSAQDQSLDIAWHAVYHFKDDADTRAEDVEYAHWQTEELSKIATALLENRSLSSEEFGFYLPRFINPLRWLVQFVKKWGR